MELTSSTFKAIQAGLVQALEGFQELVFPEATEGSESAEETRGENQVKHFGVLDALSKNKE